MRAGEPGDFYNPCLSVALRKGSEYRDAVLYDIAMLTKIEIVKSVVDSFVGR
jgi:hypothetical protein